MILAAMSLLSVQINLVNILCYNEYTILHIICQGWYFPPQAGTSDESDATTAEYESSKQTSQKN